MTHYGLIIVSLRTDGSRTRVRLDDADKITIPAGPGPAAPDLKTVAKTRMDAFRDMGLIRVQARLRIAPDVPIRAVWETVGALSTAGFPCCVIMGR
jgi:hypothetical protein